MCDNENSVIPQMCPFRHPYREEGKGPTLIDCNLSDDSDYTGSFCLNANYLNCTLYGKEILRRITNIRLPEICPLCDSGDGCRIPDNILSDCDSPPGGLTRYCSSHDFVFCGAHSLWFATMKSTGKDISGVWDEEKGKWVRKEEK